MAEFFANLPGCLIGMEACGKRSLLGKKTAGAGAHGEADGAAVRQTLRENEQA